MGKFDSKAAGASANQNVVHSNNVAQESPAAEGTMPVVIGPDVRQMLGVTGLQVISNKLKSLFSAMGAMLGRLEIAGKGADYFLSPQS